MNNQAGTRDLLLAWERVNLAIGRVECSQPMYLTEAMSELIDARTAMRSVARRAAAKPETWAEYSASVERVAGIAS